MESIRLFTWGSANLAHQEEKKGRLTPGAHADFAAYDADPFLAGSTDDLRPVLTVSLGREVEPATSVPNRLRCSSRHKGGGDLRNGQ